MGAMVAGADQRGQGSIKLSGRSVLFFSAAATRRGISFAELFGGLPLTEEQLIRSKGRVDWDIIAELSDRFERLAGGPEASMEAGLMFAESPTVKLLHGIRYVWSLRAMYEFAIHRVIPVYYPQVKGSIEFVSENELRIVLELLPQCRPSAAWFRLAYGAARGLPRVLGLPPANGFADITERRGACHLVLPRELTLRQRISRLRHAVGTPRALIDDLFDLESKMEQSQDEASRLKRDLSRVIDQIDHGIFIVRNGQFAYVNPAFVRYLGFSEATSLLGKNLADWVDPAQPGALRDLLGAVGSKAGSLSQIRRRDGSLAMLEVSAPQPFVFEGSAATLVAARDVTELKRIEHRLLLSERMASIGTLVAGVAHEINNPLTYVTLNLRMAEEILTSRIDAPRDVADSSSAEVEERDSLARLSRALGQASEGAERVRRIVADLRTFSRPDDSDREPIDVNAVVESSISMTSTLLRTRARVVRTLRNIPPALSNGSRLGQVVLNLLVNAAQAIPEGNPEDNEVRVSTSEGSERRILLEVEDTGSGIAADILPKIFDPFFSTKPVGEGTGLGLAICHELIAQMGGEITVKSTLGAGTTFGILLPSARAKALRSSQAVPPPARRARVLVVDDEPMVRSVIDLMLKGDHEVVSAKGGEEALAYAEHTPCDVILCDLMMPGFSGMDLYRTLRQRDEAQAARMVFMSGATFSKSMVQFLSEVPNPHLDKPFTYDELYAVLSSMLAESNAGPQ